MTVFFKKLIILIQHNKYLTEIWLIWYVGGEEEGDIIEGK
jgi:hypothetical protein